MNQDGIDLCEGFTSGLDRSQDKPLYLKDFPESEVLKSVDNTWGDTAKIIFNNWLGTVYQLTNRDRTQPFMPGIDPSDPLGLRAQMASR